MGDSNTIYGHLNPKHHPMLHALSLHAACGSCPQSVAHMHRLLHVVLCMFTTCCVWCFAGPPGGGIIIFTNLRESVQDIVEMLRQHEPTVSAR